MTKSVSAAKGSQIQRRLILSYIFLTIMSLLSVFPLFWMFTAATNTSLEVAQEAYTWHISQSEKSYAVLDHGKYDNSVFGLYRTLVGPDVEKNDFFEHIPPAE